MIKVCKKLRRQQGLTAVETLLALAAGALAVLGAVVLYNSAISADRVSKGSQQLVAVQQGVRSLFAGTAGYPEGSDGSLVDDVIAARAVPSDMITGSVLRHPWKGNVDIQGGTDTFTVTFEDVPDDACIKMLSSQQGTLGSGLNSVTVGSTALTLPVQVSQATSTCTGDANDISWEFQ